MRLVMYHERTPEWWGQAIWFYNKMTNSNVPQDVFAVVERAGSIERVPAEYTIYTREVLDFWHARPGLAETLLPSR